MKEIYTLADLQTWKPTALRVRLGVLGDPVAHSLSPRMQNAALVRTGLEMRYAAFCIRPAGLAEALELARRHGFVGLNLTIPHKVTAVSLVDHVDPEAAMIGAINSIKIRHGKAIGFNTDAAGFSRAVAAVFGRALGEIPTLILGAGGVARAIAFRAREEECPRLLIANRTRGKAIALAQETEAEAVSGDDLPAAVREVKLIVNATPLGLARDDGSPLPADCNLRHRFVFDTVYANHATALSKQARADEARFADGREMLLQQGALAFEQWFNLPAPLAEMRATLFS